MNPITGYLPVWLSSSQHDEYIDLLSKHHNADYFDFEELNFIETVVPTYLPITATLTGMLVCAYTMETGRTWYWYAKQNGYHQALSLMKLS